MLTRAINFYHWLSSIKLILKFISSWSTNHFSSTTINIDVVLHVLQINRRGCCCSICHTCFCFILLPLKTSAGGFWYILHFRVISIEKWVTIWLITAGLSGTLYAMNYSEGVSPITAWCSFRLCALLALIRIFPWCMQCFLLVCSIHKKEAQLTAAIRSCISVKNMSGKINTFQFVSWRWNSEVHETW